MNSPPVSGTSGPASQSKSGGHRRIPRRVAPSDEDREQAAGQKFECAHAVYFATPLTQGLNKCARCTGNRLRGLSRVSGRRRHLRRHVACVWRLRDAAPAGAVQTIYPDGRCELIVHLATPPRCWDARTGWHPQSMTPLRGAARDRHCASHFRARSTASGLRLQPAASAPLVAQHRLGSFRDRVVDLAGIDAAFGALTAFALPAPSRGRPRPDVAAAGPAHRGLLTLDHAHRSRGGAPRSASPGRRAHGRHGARRGAQHARVPDPLPRRSGA